MSISIGGMSAHFADPAMYGLLERMASSQMDLAMKLVRMSAESRIESERIDGIGEMIDTYA